MEVEVEVIIGIMGGGEEGRNQDGDGTEKREGGGRDGQWISSRLIFWIAKGSSVRDTGGAMW
jgi:hypothetical protein